MSKAHLIMYPGALSFGGYRERTSPQRYTKSWDHISLIAGWFWNLARLMVKPWWKGDAPVLDNRPNGLELGHGRSPRQFGGSRTQRHSRDRVCRRSSLGHTREISSWFTNKSKLSCRSNPKLVSKQQVATRKGKIIRDPLFLLHFQIESESKLTRKTSNS